MAKKKIVRKNRNPAAAAAVRLRQGLDAQAMAWAALLADPCNGPLAHPIYPGADGGALVRVENEFSAFGSGTDTGGLMLWLPGHPGTDSLKLSGFTNTSTPAVLGDISSGSSGYTYLRTNATNARCVAACMQVFWAGTELNRQGFVAGGCLAGGIFTDASAAVLSPDNVRPLLPNRARMPDGCFEIRWAPAAGDTLWVDPSEASTVGANINNKTCLGLAVSGIAGVGVRIRLVAVYEYVPKYNLGLVSPYNSRALSRSSLDDVINFLDRTMPSWRARISAGAAGLAYSVMNRMRGAQARLEL